MKDLKGNSSYLIDRMNREKRSATYDKIFYTSLLVGSAAFFLKFIHSQVFMGDQNRLPLVISLGLLASSLVISRRGKKHDIQSLKYKKGMMGEASVASALKNLDNNYFLINDLKLKGKLGNIDHIVLGPNGIFAVETKSFRGDIGCDGDEWTRRVKGSSSAKNLESPSYQIKRNAAEIRRLLQSAGDIVKGKILFVDGIVVFTDPEAHLELKSPTVPVVKLGELCDYIKRSKSVDRYSSRELESIAKLLLDHAD